MLHICSVLKGDCTLCVELFCIEQWTIDANVKVENHAHHANLARNEHVLKACSTFFDAYSCVRAVNTTLKIFYSENQGLQQK